MAMNEETSPIPGYVSTEQAAKILGVSKHRLYQKAIAEDWRLALDHEPGQAIVRVAQDRERPDKFLLVPADVT